MAKEYLEPNLQESAEILPDNDAPEVLMHEQQEVIDAVNHIITQIEDNQTRLEVVDTVDSLIYSVEYKSAINAVSNSDFDYIRTLVTNNPSSLGQILNETLYQKKLDVTKFILENYSDNKELHIGDIIYPFINLKTEEQTQVLELVSEEQMLELANRLIGWIAYSALDSSQKQKGIIENLSPKLLSIFAEDSLYTIITNLEDTSSNLPFQKVSSVKIIYNNEGYYSQDIKPEEVSAENIESVKIGPKISAGSDPIGYNIFVPEGEVKAVYVYVYGGYGTVAAQEKTFSPNMLYPQQSELLSHGIVIVNLNLIDLLELEVNQSDMPKDIFDRLNKSIHKFCIKLKEPSSIDAELSILEGKPLVLAGGSFGGLMSIRHQQMFEDDFDRYISLDGSLSLKHERESLFNSNDEVNKQAFQDAKEGWEGENEAFGCLDPASSPLGNKPVLIAQNLDDSNVLLSSTLDFCNKSLGEERTNLVNVYFPAKGDNVWTIGEGNKGHFPKSTKEFVDTLANFIINGPTDSSNFTQLKILVADMFSSGSKYDATIEDEFNTLIYLEDQKLTKIFGDRIKAREFLEENWNSYKSLYNMMVYCKETDAGIRDLDQDDFEDLDNFIESYYDEFLISLGVKQKANRQTIKYENCSNHDVIRDAYLKTLIDCGAHGTREVMVNAIKINPKLAKLWSLENISSPEYETRFTVAKELFFEKLIKIDALKDLLTEYQNNATDEEVLHYKSTIETIAELDLIGAYEIDAITQGSYGGA